MEINIETHNRTKQRFEQNSGESTGKTIALNIGDQQADTLTENNVSVHNE